MLEIKSRHATLVSGETMLSALVDALCGRMDLCNSSQALVLGQFENKSGAWQPSRT